MFLFCVLFDERLEMRIVNTNEIAEQMMICRHCGDPQKGKLTCCGENHFEEALVVGNEIILANEVQIKTDELQTLKMQIAGVSAMFDQLMAELKAEKKQSAKLAEALEFYANRANWQHGIAYSQNNLMIESDMYCEKGNHLYAGKTARHALAEYVKAKP